MEGFLSTGQRSRVERAQTAVHSEGSEGRSFQDGSLKTKIPVRKIKSEVRKVFFFSRHVIDHVLGFVVVIIIIVVVVLSLVSLSRDRLIPIDASFQLPIQRIFPLPQFEETHSSFLRRTQFSLPFSRRFPAGAEKSLGGERRWWRRWWWRWW